MLYTILLSFSWLSFFCLTASIILYWSNTAKWPSRLSPFGFLLLFSFVIEIASRILWFLKSNNLPVLHIYTLGEFILISWFYQKTLPHIKIYQSNNFKLIIFAISALIILNTFFLQPIHLFNSYSKTLVQIIIIIYSMLFFFNYKEEEGIDDSMHYFYKSFNSGVLIYYCGSLFIFMSSHLFLGNKSNLTGLWAINALLYLIFQIIIITSLWKLAYKLPKLSP